MKKPGIAGLSIRMAVCAMAITGIGLALPRTAAELGFTLPQQGALVSIQQVGFTLAALLGGALSDRFGKARVMRLALLAAAAAMALFGSVWAFASAVAAVLLVGASTGMLENAITALALSDEKHGDRNNILVQVAFSAGAIALPLLFLLSVSAAGVWRPPYWAAAALALVLFALTPGGKGEDRAAGVPLRRILLQFAGYFRKPACLIAPAAMFLYVGAEIGLWSFAPVYFESGGFGVYSGILSSVLIWLTMMLGRMATPRLFERFGIARTMAVFSALGIASLALITLTCGAWAIVFTAFAGFACAPVFPLILSWMTRITGDTSSTMIAFTMASGTLGSAVVGLLMGFAGNAFGPGTIMLVPLLCFAGILLLLLFFGKRGEQAAKK